MNRVTSRLPVLGFFLCATLSAHHGTNASYDLSKQVTMQGTVTEFIWTNPHCQLFFDVKDDKGNLVHWAGETNSPGVLQQAGWSKRIMKPNHNHCVPLQGRNSRRSRSEDRFAGWH